MVVKSSISEVMAVKSLDSEGGVGCYTLSVGGMGGNETWATGGYNW